MKESPWFLDCIQNPPTDPLTMQLIALVADLEPVPGPKTVGSENYSKIFDAFMGRGWEGFEDAFDAIVPRTRPDYASIKRELLREPIFNSKVHSRMTRVFLRKATIEEMLAEAEKGAEQPRKH